MGFVWRRYGAFAGIKIERYSSYDISYHTSNLEFTEPPRTKTGFLAANSALALKNRAQPSPSPIFLFFSPPKHYKRPFSLALLFPPTIISRGYN